MSTITDGDVMDFGIDELAEGLLDHADPAVRTFAQAVLQLMAEFEQIDDGDGELAAPESPVCLH